MGKQSREGEGWKWWLDCAGEHGWSVGMGVPALPLGGGTPLAGHPQEGLRQ